MGFRETVRALAKQAKLDSVMDTRKNHHAANAKAYRQNSADEIARLRDLFARNVGCGTQFAYQNKKGYGIILSVSDSSVTLVTPTIERRFRSFSLAYIYNVVKVG